MLFTIDDYKNALLFGDSFKSLSHLEPVKDENNDFIFSSGRYSVVFKMQDIDSGGYHALKCFCHINTDHLEHSKQVADYLLYIKSPYLASCRFYEDEIWLDNGMEEPAYYPIVLIDWVEGETMGKYLDRLCKTGDVESILDLAPKKTGAARDTQPKGRAKKRRRLPQENLFFCKGEAHPFREARIRHLCMDHNSVPETELGMA